MFTYLLGISWIVIFVWAYASGAIKSFDENFQVTFFAVGVALVIIGTAAYFKIKSKSHANLTAKEVGQESLTKTSQES